jgi:hypothetical protein
MLYEQDSVPGIDVWKIVTTRFRFRSRQRHLMAVVMSFICMIKCPAQLI